MCSLKVRCSSRVIPKYFTVFDLLISDWPNSNLFGRSLALDHCDLNMIKDYFFALSVSLLAMNQLFICSMIA